MLALSLLAAGPAPVPTSPAPPAPTPGTVRTFGDWAVGCDNTRRCTLASLARDGDPAPGHTVAVARAAEPAAGFELAIGSIGDGAAPAALRVGGRQFMLCDDALAGATAQRIVAAITTARTLSLLGTGGRSLATISLLGATAALRYVDAVQHRIDTVTAAVARGPGSADSIPPAPRAPTIHAPALIGTPARLSRAQVAAMQRTARCDAPPSPDLDWSPVISAVGGGASLAVLPCSAGAYNVIGALFVVRGGRVTPAAVDAPAGFEATGADPGTPVRSVVNGTVDHGILTSYAKGRGPGDCGLTQRFAWDGTRLRLIEQAEMTECRGNPDFIRTWTARIERP